MELYEINQSADEELTYGFQNTTTYFFFDSSNEGPVLSSIHSVHLNSKYAKLDALPTSIQQSKASFDGLNLKIPSNAEAHDKDPEISIVEELAN